MYFKKVSALLLAALMAASVMLSGLTAFAEEGDVGLASGDRIYFYNMAGNGAPSGDLIIVESQGHFGLIDTGHRYADTITDEDGTVYTADSARSLSCQVKNKNGRDAAMYMLYSLGITHLDFIVGTHAHSDHIGGVPEIAALTFYDENGEEKHLVDENTVYFYKSYQHINNVQDDYDITHRTATKSGAVKTSSWHNQAYVYQAVTAMQQQGCAVTELSGDVHIDGGIQPTVSYHDAVVAVNDTEGLSNARYARGNSSDYYDDYFAFDMGNLHLRLYNLFVTDTVTDDNVNSIVTVITDGNATAVSLADINVENRTEQHVAQAIADDLGTAALVKAAHHGAVSGSNSKGMLQALQPKRVVVTRAREYADGANGRGSFSAAMVYARKHYQTTFYEVGASDFGVVAEFGNGDFSMYNLSGVAEDTALTPVDQCVSTLVPINGWSHWTVEMGDPDIEDLCYLRGGEQIANWYNSDDGYWYYINENSEWQYGWQWIGGSYYYLSVDAAHGYPAGAMVTGWNYIGTVWYYFADNGKLAKGWTEMPEGWRYFNEDYSYLKNGWFKLGGSWYYFDFDGFVLTGWQKLGGKWYYLGEDGKMATGWLKVDGKWYCFDASGAMLTGWQRSGNSWYYLNGAGAMVTGWQKLGGKWYCFATNGAMQTGWYKENGKWYLFNASGAMLTGWQRSGNSWYYLNSSGAMTTGWLKLSGKWYYFNASGVMLTGKQTIGGKQYTFAASGAWIN
ncbi:MAG: hypothetical protein IJ168_08895 [Eubacterium sp.]|nr:hypothetical protein [Eubacterium sp.]